MTDHPIDEHGLPATVKSAREMQDRIAELEERISLQAHEINARSNASIRWAERAREAEQRVADLEGRLERARRRSSFAASELARERDQRETAQDYRNTAVRHAIAEVLAAKAPTREIAEEWAEAVMEAMP